MMVVHLLEVKKTTFDPKEDNKELLGPKVSYLTVIGILMYRTNYT